ncbi:MAG: hypothetical protein K1X88_23345 [Nannocystaceae bacterium]|nr:hypothetical protein [Nannocystaceae bacterium]
MTDEPKDEAPPAGEPKPAQDAVERADLPKWNRARVKRAQPAQAESPDAFQQGVRDVGRGAVRRGRLVLIGVLVVAAGIGGGIWWNSRRAETAATQTRLLAQPAAWRARGQATAELDTLLEGRKRPLAVPLARDREELARNVDTALAALAAGDEGKAQTLGLLVRAAEQMQTGDFAGAQVSYTEFLGKVGTGHPMSFLAIEGVALALEGQGDLDGAIGKLDELVGAEGDFYRDQALYHKARLLERKGSKDEALTIYRQYATEFPLDKPSLAQQQVRERLGELDPTAVPPMPEAGGLGGLLGGGGLGP